MSVTKFARDLQKVTERIPAPGAVVYNALVGKILGGPERRIAQTVAEKVEDGILVDLGSGTGYLAIEIAKRRPNLRVYGVDLSKKMVEIARNHTRGVENVGFEIGNAANFPFEDDSIDFIVSTGSLHHWKRPDKAFDECYRVLKTGKEAWIYDGCADLPKEEANVLIREYGSLRYRLLSTAQKLHGFTREEYGMEIKDILDRSKFKEFYKMGLTCGWMKLTLKKHE